MAAHLATRALLLVLAVPACLGSARCHGDFSTRSSNRGFPNVDVSVMSHEREGNIAVSVALSYHKDRDACLTIDSRWRVTVDGQPLEVDFAGRKAPPTMISGAAIQLANCIPARLTSPRHARFDRRALSVLEISYDDRWADLTVRDLFTHRNLTIHPGPRLRRGDHVTLEWHPTHDMWRRPSRSDSVAIYWPESTSTTPVRIEPPALESRPPRFTFVMPEFPPGPARISLLTSTSPRPRIPVCRWVRSCSASSGFGPSPLDVMVVH